MIEESYMDIKEAFGMINAAEKFDESKKKKVEKSVEVEVTPDELESLGIKTGN